MILDFNNILHVEADLFAIDYLRRTFGNWDPDQYVTAVECYIMGATRTNT